ncbi:hypothetical protein L486_01837 [Kwoniella mangroviensis CBS 10435]|uniref:Uncharacterized protein n=1 Tax=Kwoniella mangroviensis CBS 10435 TaxID=1331196 RepID=A0A1B9J325_9TREE|nr:hypothetical protein L486_01837 [Kwoniella mangroviensis CBS 10435]
MSVPHMKPDEDEDPILYDALLQELPRQPPSGGGTTTNANFGYDIQHSQGYGYPPESDWSGSAMVHNPSVLSSIFTQQYNMNPVEYGVPSAHYGDHHADAATSLNPGYDSSYESGHNLASFAAQEYTYDQIRNWCSIADPSNFVADQQASNAYLSPYPAQGSGEVKVSQQEITPDDRGMSFKRSVVHQTRDRFGRLYDLLVKKQGVDPSCWPTNTTIQMTKYDKGVIFGGDSNKPWTELIDHHKVKLETGEDESKVVIKCNDPEGVLVYTLMNDTSGIFEHYNKSIANITSVSLDELAQGGYLPVIACQSATSVSDRIGKTKNEISAQSRSYFPKAEDIHNNVATEYSTSKAYPYCTECGDYSRFLNAGQKAKAHQPRASTRAQRKF